jgi:hypothetical protein
MLKRFWQWYESKYKLVLYTTTLLFLIQLFHLYWMTTDIVMYRLFGHQFFPISQFWQLMVALADYTEIPAIITASILYIHNLRSGFNWRSVLFLVLINSQWLHLFWITDEIIYAQFTGTSLVVLPIWLSWIAIGIDYLELPVMADTIAKSVKSLRKIKV